MVRMESVVAPHPEKTDPVSAAADESSMPAGRQRGADSGPPLRQLDPMALSGHIALLQRAAWALCGSRHEAEDLVQDTFAQVLMRPRLLRSDNDVGYLLRALRNTHTTHQRASRRRPITVPLVETDSAHGAEVVASIDARELIAAIAAAPKPYRDVVVAVDIVGLLSAGGAPAAYARGDDHEPPLPRPPARCSSSRWPGERIETGGLEMPIGCLCLGAGVEPSRGR